MKGKCGHKPYTIISDNPKMDTSGMASKVAVVMYEHGGKVPEKYKGFSKLPENVQEKIDKDLAKKYGSGGKVYTNKNDEDTVEDMKDME